MVSAILDAFSRNTCSSRELCRCQGVGDIGPIPSKRYHLRGLSATVGPPGPLGGQSRDEPIPIVDDEDVALPAAHIPAHVKAPDVGEGDFMANLPAVREAALEKVDQKVTEESPSGIGFQADRPLDFNTLAFCGSRPEGKKSDFCTCPPPKSVALS